MKILASNHSSFPRIGDDPSQQKYRQAYAKMERGEITKEDFERVQDDVTKEAIEQQVQAGLDIITDGQIRWYDPISHLARHLEGCEVDGLLRFFDTNFYFRQPVVKGEIKRKEPVICKEFEFAKRVSPKPLKAVVTGPYTLAKLSINQSSSGFDSVLRGFLKVVSEEIADLARAGAALIQVEEPAILKNSKDLPEFRKAIEELVTSKGRAKILLCTYFGDAAPIYPRLMKLPVDGLIFDFTYSPKLLNTIARFGCSKYLGLGVVDGRNTRVENASDISKNLKKVISSVGSEEIHIMPSCGIGDYLPRDVAFRKLQKVAEIADEVGRSNDA